jgi:23S rRNA G2445 N2-methylase RlmL
MPTQSYDCYAITPPGVESITARELSGLGIAPGGSEPGGVSFRSDAGGIARANLELRTASRLLVRVATFHASAFHELERRADRLAWEAMCRLGDRWRSGSPPESRSSTIWVLSRSGWASR